MNRAVIWRRWAAVWVLAALGAVVISSFRNRPMAPTPLQTLPRDGVRAPEFPAGFAWLNTEKPLSLRGLRGKLVLLDFWTYGCINCMHILPDLHKLEQKYAKELVIIGVHSAKFENESDAANIRNAMLRYNIEHPILVDQRSQVWDAYAVNAWPTLILIDPSGRIVGQVAGEGNYDILDRTIAQVADEFRKKGELNETPLQFALDRAKVAPTPLWYPGKILAAGGKLFISDSNHNRIVIASPDGKTEAVIGSGEAALRDGTFEKAAFANPQGLALGGDVLYVADTNNHAIRAVDLKQKTVRTIAGTGKQAPWRSTGGVGTAAALSSPWDVLLYSGTLYIAMAGPHQIWAMDPASGRVSVYAGSGAEARRDGSLRNAAFAQPSGLATDGKRLFVADSESSSIRAVDLPGNGEQVTTLAGGDLFDFGDQDGKGLQVRLQHPLGLAYKDGALYIADTYNSKIKRLDPQNGEVTALLGGRDTFYEPSGLAFQGDTLLVADTNNHAIRRVDLAKKSAAPLPLAGLAAPAATRTAESPRFQIDSGMQLVAVQPLAPGAKGTLVFDARLPAGFHLNPVAPQRFSLKVIGDGLTFEKTEIGTREFALPLRVPFQAARSGKGTVTMTATVSYCNEGKGAVCKLQSLKLRAPFEIKEGGAQELKVGATLK